MKFLWLGFEKNRSMDILVSSTAELPSHHHNIIIIVISSLLLSPCPQYTFHSNSLSSNLTHPTQLHQHTSRAKKTKNWKKSREKKVLRDKKPISSKCLRRVGGGLQHLSSKLVTAHSKTCNLDSKHQKNCSLHFTSLQITSLHLTSPFPFKFIDRFQHATLGAVVRQHVISVGVRVTRNCDLVT